MLVIENWCLELLCGENLHSEFIFFVWVSKEGCMFLLVAAVVGGGEGKKHCTTYDSCKIDDGPILY